MIVSLLNAFWCTLTHPSYNSLTIRAQVVVFTYPMVHHCDMEERMAQEVMDVCVNACEKHWINWSNSQMVCPHINRNQDVVIFLISFYKNNIFSARSLSRRRLTPGMKLPACLVFDNISKPPTNNMSKTDVAPWLGGRVGLE